MSKYEGLPLKTMNPFSNNKPRLTASERIRNKRDATIYNAEKQKFQESKKYNCTKGGVKFYKNGKIKSMISYKLQKRNDTLYLPIYTACGIKYLLYKSLKWIKIF